MNKRNITLWTISIILGIGISIYFLWESFFPVRAVPQAANQMNYISAFDIHFQRHFKVNQTFPDNIEDLCKTNRLNEEKDLFGPHAKEWAKFEDYRYNLVEEKGKPKTPILLYRRKDKLKNYVYIVLYSDSSAEQVAGESWDNKWKEIKPFK